MSAPRVLQVVLSLDPGGTERLVLELVRRLHREIPTAVCCLDTDGAWAPELRSYGADVTALGRPSGFAPSIGHAVARAAQRHGARVLHCHHYSPFVYGSLARLWAPRLRVIFTEHGRLSDAGPSLKRRLANQLLARAPHAVFTVSEDLKRHIVAEGFDPRAVQVIYNGVDVGVPASEATRVRMRQRLAIPNEALVVGTVARLDPVKDLKTLIGAAKYIELPGPVVLLIVGDGPERRALEACASSSGARVIFAGQQNNVREWLAACDVYVNTSISEGVSLTILEAMSAGLPVVATRVGGTPEVITDECGRLVSAREVDQIARAIMSVALDAPLRRALGDAARRRVVEHFSIERMVSDYRRVYYEAA